MGGGTVESRVRREWEPKMRMPTMPRAGVATALFAMSLVLPAAARAIPIAGSGPLGSFEGTFDYDDVTDTVLVTLMNTSDPLNGGFITAFAFNLPIDSAADAELVAPPLPLVTDTDFVLMFGDNSINAAPLGSFDIGATTDTFGAPPPSWLGGGDPSLGIGVGATASFAFHLIGAENAGLSAEVLLSELSFMQDGSDGYPFAVRFRGFEDDGSDKVVGGVVPEPGTLLLLGGGLTALAMRRRRPRV